MYQPGVPPVKTEDLRKYVFDELRRIADVFGAVDGSGGQVALDGRVTLLDAVYDDLPPSVFSTGKLPGANFPAWNAFITATYAFQFAVNDYLWATPIEVTHGYEEGTDLMLHIHWATGGSNVNARYVKWEVIWTIGNGSEEFSGETTSTVEVSIPAGAGATRPYHQISGVVTIPGTAVKIGAYIKARVRRIAATGTAPTSDPFGLALGVHVQQDTLGSAGLFTK